MSKSSFYSGSGLTTTEQSTLEGIQGASEAARDAAQASATSASTSATSASTSATSAAASAASISTETATQSEDGLMSSVDKTKLDGVEASATADQTAAEIKTAYESNSNTNAFTDADHSKLDAIEASATADQSASEIKTAYESNSDTNAFTDADHSKLDAIEASADVTDATNVTAAGALMDSEVTNLAQVKAFDSSDYATAAQGTLAGTAVQPNDSPSFGSITVSGNVDGRDIAADGTKLDGIEAGADVTDTANVTSAGALMDSEVTNLAQVKAFDSSDYATAAQGTTADAALPKSGGTMTGDVAYGDNVKATFGASADLQVYHTGSTSYIYEQGTGDLRIRGNEVRIEDGDGSTIALFQNNAGAQLQHNGTTVLNTNANGIDVTGIITVDDLLNIESTTDFGRIEIGGPSGAFIDLKTPFSDDYDGRLHCDGNSLYLTTNSDIPVLLKHSNVETMRTTSTGIEVTGNLAVTGTVDGRNVATDGTKLDGIEAAADVTDTDNVTAAGALMDSEVTNLAQVKAFDSSDYATAAQGTTATNALPKAGGTMTGDIVFNSGQTFDGRDVSTDGTKLDGIEAGADVTDATNVAAAVTTGWTVAVGDLAGLGDTLTASTYVGYKAGNYDTASKDYQTAIGYSSMDDCDGDFSTAVGASSMTDGNHYKSVAVGFDALGRLSTSNAQYNTAVGADAGDDIYSGDYNTLVGYNSDVLTTSGFGGTAVGAFSRVAGFGVALGYSAGSSGTSGDTYNVLVGYNAGYDLDGGDYNVFVGYESGYNGGGGSNNAGVGRNSLRNLTFGSDNTTVGSSSLYALTSGDFNVGLGKFSGYTVSTSDGNSLLGAKAGYAQGGSTTNALTTGSNVTCVGYESVPSSSTATNEVTLGDNNITSLRCNVQTISSLSDERDKTAITDLTHGLDFINDMRPVEFTWNRRDGSMGSTPDMGFIAQDLYDVELTHSSTSRTRLVKWDDPSRLEADYIRSYPILVKAVQELAAQNKALEARINTLEGN